MIQCRLCSTKLKYYEQSKHYRDKHGYKFHWTGRKAYGGGNHIVCDICGAKVESLAMLVKNHTFHRGYSCQAASVPVVDNPSAQINSFFNNIHALITELKQLRIQAKEWQDKAQVWAAKVVELQEIMSRSR